MVSAYVRNIMQTANKHLKSISEIIAGLSEPSDQKKLLSVNIDKFHARDRMIKELSVFLSSMAAVASEVSTCIKSLTDTKSAEIELARLLIGGESPPVITKSNTTLQKPWASRVSNAGQSVPKISDRMVSLKPSLSCATAQSSVIKITDGLSVQAVVIGSFADVKQNGQLYYVSQNDHFAIKLAGVLFHGNIGTVYDSEREPEKIKDCRFGSECNRMHKCNYYHDPTIFPTSQDHRNFIATSFTYSKYKNGRNRSFGSRPHLEEDVLQLTCDDAYKFYDQTMHDILCSLVLISAGKIR